MSKESLIERIKGKLSSPEGITLSDKMIALAAITEQFIPLSGGTKSPLFSWLQEAMKKGVADQTEILAAMQKSTDRIAQSCVAFLQWWGIGLKEDRLAAYKLLQAAAEAGSACAEYRMGEWHHAAKDKAGADYWFRRSIAGEEEPFPPAAAALRGEEPTTTIISATTVQNSTPPKEQNVCVKH